MRTVVASSDWHGDVLTAGFPRYDDVEAAVEETVRAAVDAKADLYAFLGDLADPDAPGAWRACALACRTAGYLAAKGIPSVWVVGNHDVLEDGSGDHVLHPVRYASLNQDGHDVHVCGEPRAIRFPAFDVVALPYAPRSHEYDPERFVRELPAWVGAQGRRVLFLGHLELQGILDGSESFEMRRGRDAVHWPVAAVLERFGDQALMLAGHYHRRQVHRGVQVVGSLERVSFADGTSAPGYLVVEVDA